MITIYNVMTGVELTFDAMTCPEYAVAYGHCVEDEKLASWFFHAARANLDWKKTIKIWKGKKTISCGDWVYRK